MFYQKSQMQEILIINNFIFVLPSLLFQLLEAWVKTAQLSTDRHVVLNQVTQNFWDGCGRHKNAVHLILNPDGAEHLHLKGSSGPGTL